MIWYILPVAICIVLICIVLVMKRMSRQASELKIVEAECVSENRDEAVTRFCFISDVHITSMPVKWGSILSAIRESGAEFILITGDLVNKEDDCETARQFIFTLSVGTKLPVIITLGNHDNEAAARYEGGRDAFIESFTSIPGDVRIIDDDYTVAANVLIGGIGDLRTRKDPPDDLIRKWAVRAGEKGLDYILATHNADVLLTTRPRDELIPEGAAVPACVFCGHTHGGQIRLVSGIEFKIIKDDKLPKQGVYYGSHRVAGYDVLITSGLGCSLVPLRSGTSPEVVVVILKPV